MVYEADGAGYEDSVEGVRDSEGVGGMISKLVGELGWR